MLIRGVYTHKSVCQSSSGGFECPNVLTWDSVITLAVYKVRSSRKSTDLKSQPRVTHCLLISLPCGEETAKRGRNVSVVF